MKCPACGKNARISNTREKSGFVRTRWYVCKCENRFTTKEFLSSEAEAIEQRLKEFDNLKSILKQLTN